MAKTGLTEREIIGTFKRRFASGPKLPLGFDDDVAAFPMSQGRLVVLKTDMLVGSTDVPRGMTLGQAASKAVVATVSDFAAKGVEPRGLRILSGKKKPWPRRFSKLVYSVLHPAARLETGLKLARTGFVNSSIDSIDGLAWSLHEIARLSEVSIFLEEIPVAQGAQVFPRENALVPEELALFGGEEYELVLTIKKDRFESLKRKIPSLQRIGTVKSGLGDVIMDYRGKNRKVEPRGYEHFT